MRASRTLLLLGASVAFLVPRTPHPQCPKLRAGSLVEEREGLCGRLQHTPRPARAHGAAGQLLGELSQRPVLSATSAGVCAAVVMAVLGALLDPIKDRFLYRRLYFDRPLFRCRLEIGFLVQMIKFPVFEPLLLWILSTKLLHCSMYARAALAGAAFAVLTLPFTNFRSGVTNRAMAGHPFKAVVPTICRDVVYALGRAALPAVAAKYGGCRVTSPEALFAAVCGSCLLAAPFNELRDRQLSKSYPSAFLPIRAAFFSVLRSLAQAASLVVGYRYAPKVVHTVIDYASRWKFSKSLLYHWKVAPDLELWALAGILGLLLLVGCMIKNKMNSVWRSQPDLLREMLLEN